MSKEELRNRLVEQIREAFTNVDYPGDADLYRNEETKELIGKHWSDVPFEMLRVQSRILYLTPKALRFYLPAYLIGIISDSEKMDTLVDDIVHFLSPSAKLSWKEETISYIPEFGASEKAAIRAFFEAYKELFPERSWKHFQPSKEALERGIAYWQHYG